jgi:hypothetical protein
MNGLGFTWCAAQSSDSSPAVMMFWARVSGMQKRYTEVKMAIYLKNGAKFTLGSTHLSCLFATIYL